VYKKTKTEISLRTKTSQVATAELRSSMAPATDVIRAPFKRVYRRLYSDVDNGGDENRKKCSINDKRSVYKLLSSARAGNWLSLDQFHHRPFVLTPSSLVSTRGVDPYGTGGTRPPNIWTGGHYHECPPIFL